MYFAWLVTLALVSMLAPASVVHAQDATADGRRAYADGVSAADEERWPDAADAFHRAYELTGRPAALHNYGVALRALGRYVDALAAFEELLTLDRASEDDRAAATQYRDEMRSRIALVRLFGLDRSEHYELQLDGALVADDGTRPIALHTDPGAHAIDVGREGYQRFEWRGALSDGQSLDLTITLEPIPVAAAPAPGPNYLEEPWLWIVIGVAVAVAAGVLIWFADDRAQLRCESPMCAHL